MNKLLFYTLTVLTVGLTSCSNHLRYFTDDLYRDYQWTDRELSKIQFYVSEDIVLQRRISDESTKITNGKIRVVDGSKIEEVIIEKGTPGVFVQSPKDNKFAISFDSGDETKYLMFGPNQKANGKYVLLAKDWSRNRGQISYGGRTYDTSSASAYAALMVDIKKAKKTQVKSTVAKGNKVN